MMTVSEKGDWENACGTAGESLLSSQAGAPSTKTTTRWSSEAGRSLLLWKTFSADSQSLIIARCIQPVSKGIELDF